MALPDDIAYRITRSDQIATDAIAATTGSNDLFEDLSGISVPNSTPASVSISLAPLSLNDVPTAPDDHRIIAAAAALGQIPAEAAAFDAIRAGLDTALAEFDGVVSEATARIPGLTSLAAGIVVPQASDFGFAEDDFRSTNALDQTLKDIIETEITTGGEGYSEETETAMYDLNSERSEVVRQEAIDDALDNLSGSGFPCPQGHHVEAVRKINEQYRLDSEKRSSDTMLLQSKLSLENKWKALNAGITYNQLMIAYFDGKAQRALEAAIAVIGLKIQAIRYNVDFIRKTLEIGKAVNKADIDSIRMIIDGYSVDVLKFRKQLDGLFAMAKGYTDQYRGKAQVYMAQVSAAAEKSTMTRMENTLSLETQKLNIMAGVVAAQQAHTNFIAQAEMRLGSATNGAKIQKGIAMATLESLSTIVNRANTGELSS